MTDQQPRHQLQELEDLLWLLGPPPPEQQRTDAWAARIALDCERDGGPPARSWKWYRRWAREQTRNMRRSRGRR